MALDDATASVRVTLDNNGARVISLAGELDIASVPRIEAQLGPLLDMAATPLTFDMSSLTFMDSSGIAMLLRTADKLGPLAIRKPSRTVQRIIAATGLQDVLRVET